MTQEEQVTQEELQQVETHPSPEETTGPVPQDQEQESPQAINMRNLREAKDRAERDRDALLKRVAAIEAAQKQKQQPEAPPPEDLSIAPDDLVEGKHLSKYDRKIKELESQLQNYKQQTTTTAVEAKLHAQYPDFNTVVTEDNVKMLSSLHPELAQTINASGDLYNKAVSAYTLIKKLGITPQNTYDAERARAQQNAAKPRPLASVSSQQGDSPLTKANAFADGLTDELKKQLHKEMIESMR
jgi:hypothetical protein